VFTCDSNTPSTRLQTSTRFRRSPRPISSWPREIHARSNPLMRKKIAKLQPSATICNFRGQKHPLLHLLAPRVALVPIINYPLSIIHYLGFPWIRPNPFQPQALLAAPSCRAIAQRRREPLRRLIPLKCQRTGAILPCRSAATAGAPGEGGSSFCLCLYYHA
jgi:hypothetical protein